MKTLFCIAACLFSITCFGQTKLISFRSHSGSNANFRTAVEKNLFDIGESNFGTRTDYMNKIEKVSLKSGNLIIIRRRVYRKVIPLDTAFKYQSTKFDTLTTANAENFFKANSIDGLKAELRKKYGMYGTPQLDSTLFVGFDKKFKQKQGSRKK